MLHLLRCAAQSCRQLSPSFDREGYDEVTGKRPLRTLRSSAEWRGIVQGRVVANLRPDNVAFDLFRDGRLDGKSDRQRTVGSRSATDGHAQWVAMSTLTKSRLPGKQRSRYCRARFLPAQ